MKGLVIINNFDVVFCVLTYKNFEDLKVFMKNLEVMSLDFTYKVIVVNSYADIESSREIKRITKNFNGLFIECDNKGYSYGNNLGIQTAITDYDFKHLVVCNPDTEIELFSYNQLKDISGIVAPKIIALNGKNQNPMYFKRFFFSEWLVYKGFKLDFKYLMYLGILFNKVHRIWHSTLFKISKKHQTKIYCPHGSYIIFDKVSLEKLLPVFDNDIFLYSEENILAQKAKKSNVEIFYDENIIIKHKEDGSMNLSDFNLYNLQKESYIKYFEKWAK